jgi:DNA-binding CsgD family transcriptional regulator
LTEAVALVRQGNDSKWLALNLSVLGLVERAQGALDVAVALLEEADAIWRERESAWGLGVTSLGLATVALEQGNLPQATSYCLASLLVRHAESDHWGVSQCLVVAAGIARRQGDPVATARFLGAEEALREARGDALSYGLRQIVDDALPAARDSLVETRFRAAWAEGGALPRDDVIAQARVLLAATEGGGRTARRTGSVPAAYDLTPRELEVLRHLARGESDREIADVLFISHHTVMKHVANILGKMGVASRTAAATLALQEELL